MHGLDIWANYSETIMMMVVIILVVSLSQTEHFRGELLNDQIHVAPEFCHLFILMIFSFYSQIVLPYALPLWLWTLWRDLENNVVSWCWWWWLYSEWSKTCVGWVTGMCIWFFFFSVPLCHQIVLQASSHNYWCRNFLLSVLTEALHPIIPACSIWQMEKRRI